MTKTPWHVTARPRFGHCGWHQACVAAWFGVAALPVSPVLARIVWPSCCAKLVFVCATNTCLHSNTYFIVTPPLLCVKRGDHGGPPLQLLYAAFLVPAFLCLMLQQSPLASCFIVASCFILASCFIVASCFILHDSPQQLQHSWSSAGFSSLRFILQESPEARLCISASVHLL